MKLDPVTTRDFHRIYRHHEENSDEGRADEVEEQLYADAAACDSYPTATHRGLTFKRARNGYRFFYATSSGIDVIYAIYHQRENWQSLIDGRYGNFSDA